MEDLDMDELEKEQLDYLRRNYDDTLNVPNSTDMNLDVLEKPIDERIILTPEQEKRLVDEVMKRQSLDTPKAPKDNSFSLDKYFKILSESFVDVMDDIVNFDGDVENISNIFTRGDRLVLVGTVILVLSVLFIYYKR